jgi:hypothetical protein
MGQGHFADVLTTFSQLVADCRQTTARIALPARMHISLVDISLSQTKGRRLGRLRGRKRKGAEC